MTPDRDPELAAALAASADERVRQRIAAATTRREQLDAARARRNAARRHGLGQRHAAKLRRNRQASTDQAPRHDGTGGDAA